jgi:cell division septation protein DedD
VPVKEKTLFQLLRKELVKYGLYFFVCAWMFLLGLLVGRGTVPVRFNANTLELELKTLKEEARKKEKENFKIITENLSDKSDLLYPEELKDTQYALKTRTEEPNPANQTQKEKTVPEKAALVTKEDDPTSPDNSVETIENTKKVSIQIASFRKPEDADRMVEQLKSRGYDAYKATAEIPGSGLWHRVRIGAFNRRIDAKEIMERLKKEHLIGMFVNIED